MTVRMLTILMPAHYRSSNANSSFDQSFLWQLGPRVQKDTQTRQRMFIESRGVKK